MCQFSFRTRYGRNRGLGGQAKHVSLALTLLTLTLATAKGTVAGNANWDSQFGWPGVTNSPIYAIAINGPKVYVSGQGNLAGVPVSLWDGKQWSVVGQFTGPGPAGPLPQISDLALVGNTLYATGSFTNVNGVAAAGLAKWDGTNWTAFGFSGTGYALAADGNNLYVGGSFVNPGGLLTTNIACWNGSTWQALGNGLGPAPGFPFSVRSVVAQNGTVYAGGLFYVGSATITNLAVWNGTSWSSIGAPNSTVYSLAIHNGALHAGGSFTKIGTASFGGVAKWDGVNWNPLGSGVSGGSATVESMTSFNGALCMAGAFLSAGGVAATNFATWNGSTWAASGNLNSVAYRAVASGGELYLGGVFTTVGGVWVNRIAGWDGSQWSALVTSGRRNGVQSTVTALATDGTNLYAGGFFAFAGQTNAGFIARFDGTRWQPLGAGLNNEVVALAVTNNRIYAGGFFTGTADGQALTYIGCWDGTNWNSLGNAGGVVYALAAGTNGLYAAGTYYTGSAYGAPYFNRWDGTNWSSMISFPLGNTFFAVPLADPVGYDAIAIQGANIFLGGNILGFSQFDPNVGPSPATNCGNIMRFDGTTAWIMGTGLNRTNVALAAVGTNLYAAGSFTVAGSVAANQIAVWNGQAWSGVGGGVVGSGTVLALAAMGNNLFAAGTFTNMGGVTANRIAKWDGTNWSALGDGIFGTVQSLTAVGSSLYAGGNFRLAGNKNVNDLARWNEQLNFDMPQLSKLGSLLNGQFGARLSGIAGLTNVIEGSTNFTAWTPVLTNSTGIYDYTNSDPIIYRARYYRARLGP